MLLSERSPGTLSECHFPLRATGPEAPNRVAPNRVAPSNSYKKTQKNPRAHKNKIGTSPSPPT